MKRPLLYKFVSGIFGLALVFSIVFVYTSSTAVKADDDNKPEDTASAQVQTNKMVRSDWHLTATDIRFWSGDAQPTTKAAEIQFTFEGAEGKEKPFLPTGKIVAVTGNSGKVYPLDHFTSIDQVFMDSKPSRERPAEGATYHPGEFKLAYFLMVDKEEETFKSVTYQFDSGKEIEIPINGITPEIMKPNPNAK